MIEILYRDEFLLAAVKPAGIPVHETKDPKRENFTGLVQKELSLPYIRTVNRLDLETSGIVLFGLTEERNKEIDEILKNADKYYLALVEGNPPDEFRIESFLKDGNKRVSTVRSGGKKAITEFKTLERLNDRGYSLVSAHLITGRRHQIRIHLFENGFPILGDKVYTNRKTPLANRSMLHAYELHFQNLFGENIQIKAKPPNDFLKFLNR
ncbi:MAG TPA: RluA family pseudouridine synthase [Leptospiraceae bacterium]|nr:RluA family pseudouridine synthase [Leptospiraceae bacterium]HMW04200.1 RluA family pseudouridine synthase [Leptospiraceae bacterium]HMX32732.1 RluA family pseudouridine synthase [Leptospiraceae bacterium]HMY30193.1 RluA family pseudouridine synthase [Leptospiraceae bacterium]HMZ65176.1 RluA family pseudouridine synthase [Leptospiraceae bacterium]